MRILHYFHGATSENEVPESINEYGFSWQYHCIARYNQSSYAKHEIINLLIYLIEKMSSGHKYEKQIKLIKCKIQWDNIIIKMRLYKMYLPK